MRFTPLLLLSVLAVAEASKPKLIKNADILDTGNDWVNFGNGFGFQPGDLDMKDPRVLAATVEAQNRLLQSKNNSAYENQFIDAADTIYDDYAQAWRLLGFYIDCNTLDYGDDQDNAAGSCVRYLMWAAYVDIFYEGNGVGEYQYFNHKTGIWDDTACKYLNSSRCARMDCHLSNTTFSLLGVFKEPDYHEWMEQLFKHQGVCLWSEDDYELMQDDREEWPEGCTESSVQDDDGSYLYYDLKPKPKGRIDVGIYTDSKCSEDYEGDYSTKQVLASNGGDVYYLESSIYNWSRAFDVFRVCQPCKTYDLSYIPSAYNASDTKSRYSDDYFSYAEQQMEGDPFDCFDDADYTNVNQCMKFASKTEMQFATFDDMILASMQGTITPFKFNGRLYGGSQNGTYIDEDRYLAGIQSILGKSAAEEYALQNALLVGLLAAASVIIVVFGSIGMYRLFKRRSNGSFAIDGTLLEPDALVKEQSGIVANRSDWIVENRTDCSDWVMENRTNWSEASGPASDSEVPPTAAREYFEDECLPEYKPGYSGGVMELEITPVNTPVKNDPVVSQSPHRDALDGLTPSRLDFSGRPHDYGTTPRQNETTVSPSPARGLSAVDDVAIPVKNEPVISSSSTPNVQNELPPYETGFSGETTQFAGTPVKSQPSVAHSPAPGYSAPLVPESPAGKGLPPHEPGFTNQTMEDMGTPVKNQPAVSQSPAPDHFASAVPESPAHNVTHEIPPPNEQPAVSRETTDILATTTTTTIITSSDVPLPKTTAPAPTDVRLPKTTAPVSTLVESDTGVAVAASTPMNGPIALEAPEHSTDQSSLDLVGAPPGNSDTADNQNDLPPPNTVDEPSVIPTAVDDETSTATSRGDAPKLLPSFD